VDFKTGFLIGADGASSRLRELLFPEFDWDREVLSV